MSDENELNDDESGWGFDWRGLGQAVWYVLLGLAFVLLIGHDFIIQIIHAVQGR